MAVLTTMGLETFRGFMLRRVGGRRLCMTIASSNRSLPLVALASPGDAGKIRVGPVGLAWGSGKELIVSHPALTLELPEDIYERVRRAAKGMNQPMEKALVNIVRAATPSLEKVPAEYRTELEAMEDLGDEDLWRILRGRPAAAKQRRLEGLLDKRQRGSLNERETQALSELRLDGDRLLLRRAYAALLLKYRGHRIPTIEDLA
jgi:hypothetical protein